MADSPIKPAESQLSSAERTVPEPLRSFELGPEAEQKKESATTEAAKESAVEAPPSRSERAEPSAPAARVAMPVSAKDPVVAQIEELLSEDLTDAFLNMSSEKQREFKQKGEETAGKIRVMLEQVKVNTRKIFNLIRAWLKLIPGMNRFFLEQEAKIKTDKILRLKP